MDDTEIERNRIRLEVSAEIELGEGGPKLVPGAYEGKVTQIAVIKGGEHVWLPKKYFLELDAEQIEAMGGSLPENDIIMLYDVTPHVECGSITLI